MTQYILIALASALFMASSGVIARFSKLGAAELTFYRLAVGACCLAVFLLLSGKARYFRQAPNAITILNGILLAAFMLGFLAAIQTIHLANAIMIVYLAPPVTAVIAHWWFGETLDLKSVLWIALALLGFAMLQSVEFQLSESMLLTEGYRYALLSLVAYSAYLLLNRQPSADHPVLQRTFYQLLVGACCLLPFLTQLQFPPAQAWLWIALAGIFPGFLAILCAVIALAHLPNRVYGTLAYIEPVAVILAGVVLFAEVLSGLQYVGIAFILLSGMMQAANAKPSTNSTAEQAIHPSRD